MLLFFTLHLPGKMSESVCPALSPLSMCLSLPGLGPGDPVPLRPGHRAVVLSRPGMWAGPRLV